MTEHTPGPWFARQQFTYDKRSLAWIIETENESRIGWSYYADAVTNEGEQEPHKISGANALLIAAAPDLLSAAKAAVESLAELCRFTFDSAGCDHAIGECEYIDAMGPLFAAIEKAGAK